MFAAGRAFHSGRARPPIWTERTDVVGDPTENEPTASDCRSGDPGDSVGCPCRGVGDVGVGGRVLLGTRVDHIGALLRSVGRDCGAEVAEPAPGLVEMTGIDPGRLFTAARGRLSALEAREVRVLVLPGETGRDGASGSEAGLGPVAGALSAISLAQAAAQVEHAQLRALLADEARAFRSVYQPIVDLAATAGAGAPVIGYEALLRASGPDGGVPPLPLFAAAEEAGWSHVLDRVGRTTALRGASEWLGSDLLFVNFLPNSIYRPSVCLRTTEQAAREAGLRLDQLVFEVTESERVIDHEHLADVFAYYQDRGCQVALDDLGAGYSSLNLLVRLQPDVVKIDKEIVGRLPQPTSVAVLEAVLEITHSYGGRVLAECVETAEQAAAARDLGVDLAQGWFFGHPLERSALAG